MEEKFRRLINFKLFVFIGIIFVLLSGFFAYQIVKSSDKALVLMARQEAKSKAALLESLRTIYTRDVVSKIENSKVVVSHDFHGKSQTIPLPATLVKSISEHTNTKVGGIKTFLYSAYPFPWRVKDEGLNDNFRKKAWAFLSEYKDRYFEEIVTVGNKRFLRFAKSDLMRKSCIKCHNSHQDSPKTNWKIGDTRGILEVQVPIKRRGDELSSTLNQSYTVALMTIFLGTLVLIATGYVIMREQKKMQEKTHRSKLKTKRKLDILDEMIENKSREVFERSRELEKANLAAAESARLASLGEMAGGIAHEINNPLTIISGSVNLLSKAMQEGKINEKLLGSVVANISKTIQRMAKIVAGMRAVSRESSIDGIEPIKLKELLTDFLFLCSEKFKYIGVDIEIDLDLAEFKQLVMADRVQILQVFVNLFGNAFDAIENLDERWLKVEAEEVDNHLLVKIIDSGKGIPQKIQDKMFNPFYTSKPVGKGTGLGLSISKKIMNKFGGDLYIDNSCKNTCFVVKLQKA